MGSDGIFLASSDNLAQHSSNGMPCTGSMYKNDSSLSWKKASTPGREHICPELTRRTASSDWAPEREILRSESGEFSVTKRDHCTRLVSRLIVVGPRIN